MIFLCFEIGWMFQVSIPLGMTLKNLGMEGKVISTSSVWTVKKLLSCKPLTGKAAFISLHFPSGH